jgi:hypothetical protein
MTTAEDDQTLAAAALHNNWANINELKETPELRDNEHIQSISKTTIRSRLKEQGF